MVPEPIVDLASLWQRDNSHLSNLWRYCATVQVNAPFGNRRGCSHNWSHPERRVVAAKKRRGGCRPWMGSIRGCCAYMIYDRWQCIDDWLRKICRQDLLIKCILTNISPLTVIILTRVRKKIYTKLVNLLQKLRCVMLSMRARGGAVSPGKQESQKGKKRKFVSHVGCAGVSAAERFVLARCRASFRRNEKYKERIIMEFAKFNWISAGSCYWERQLITRHRLDTRATWPWHTGERVTTTASLWYGWRTRDNIALSPKFLASFPRKFISVADTAL